MWTLGLRWDQYCGCGFPLLPLCRHYQMTWLENLIVYGLLTKQKLPEGRALFSTESSPVAGPSWSR